MFKRGCEKTDPSIDVGDLIKQMKEGEINTNDLTKLFNEDKLSATDFGRIDVESGNFWKQDWTNICCVPLPDDPPLRRE